MSPIETLSWQVNNIWLVIFEFSIYTHCAEISPIKCNKLTTHMQGRRKVISSINNLLVFAILLSSRTCKHMFRIWPFMGNETDFQNRNSIFETNNLNRMGPSTMTLNFWNFQWLETQIG